MFPLVFPFLFHGKYVHITWSSLLYHMMFQEVHTRKRKEIESKHHGTAKELTSEHQRFDWTEILYSLERKEAICSSLGSRSVLVVWQAGRLAG